MGDFLLNLKKNMAFLKIYYYYAMKHLTLFVKYINMSVLDNRLLF